MSKKHFIALADAIREHNKAVNTPERYHVSPSTFDEAQIETLAQFCQATNERFNRERWLGYIAGTNGKNGGKVK